MGILAEVLLVEIRDGGEKSMRIACWLGRRRQSSLCGHDIGGRYSDRAESLASFSCGWRHC